MIDKGMVSTVSADGKAATVVPAFSGPSVTFPLVVPFFLAGSLTVKMPVVYATFPDNTGVILARMDGEWNRELSGDLTIKGMATVGDLKTGAVPSYNTHTHGGVESGGGSTSGPQ